MIGTLAVFQNNLNLYRSGILPEDTFEVYQRDIVGLLKSPGAALWWNEIKHLLSTNLYNYVDEILESLGPDIPPLSESMSFIEPGEIAGPEA